MAKITLRDIKAKTDTMGDIKTEVDRIKNIETKVGKVADIETKVGKIDGIKTKVDKMEAEIQALNVLIGKQDSQDHKNDTGIYKVIHDNFTELMGGP